MQDFRDKGHSIEHCDAGLAANLRRPPGEVRRWWHNYWTEQRALAAVREAFDEGYDEGEDAVSDRYDEGFSAGQEAADDASWDEGYDKGYNTAKEEDERELDHLRTTLRLVGELDDD